jgi:hypothetical protein
MNKKAEKVKKLVLAKETVRRLEDMTLDRAAGGATQYCQNTDVCTYDNSCKVFCLPEPISYYC